MIGKFLQQKLTIVKMKKLSKIKLKDASTISIPEMKKVLGGVTTTWVDCATLTSQCSTGDCVGHVVGSVWKDRVCAGGTTNYICVCIDK